MQIIILKDVVSSIAGEKAKSLVDLLSGKKNVNEFLIAKKLKLTINQTRNILYKLADEGIVSFIRKKDSRKGGWYTYFWTINPEKGMMKFKGSLTKMISDLKIQIKSKETERFYYSPSCGLEFTEEAALTNNYTCPECGEILQLKDNTKEIVTLIKEVDKNEALLEKVNFEIGLLEQKDEKIKIRKIKAEDKKKKAEREARKKQKQKELKKLKKKAHPGKLKNQAKKRRK